MVNCLVCIAAIQWVGLQLFKAVLGPWQGERGAERMDCDRVLMRGKVCRVLRDVAWQLNASLIFF